jgi:hypothetical protein
MAIKVSGTTVIDDSRNMQNIGIITATTFIGALTGNSSTATSAATLTTARTINGISFNGSIDIEVNPASGAFSNGQGARTIQSGGTASGGSSGDIFYIY